MSMAMHILKLPSSAQVGLDVGPVVGFLVGLELGTSVGFFVGSEVGFSDGSRVGCNVVGSRVGLVVGCRRRK